MKMRNVSSADLMHERKLKQVVAAEAVVTTDRTKFEELCDKFRKTCFEFRDLAKWPDFRGSYDECEIAVDRDDLMALPRAQQIYNKLNILNSACKHEGEKLGYRLAEWWLYCWKEELAKVSSKPLKFR